MEQNSEQSWVHVADRGALELNDGRLHLQIGGRYISIISHQDQLYCIDSICFHAGGPLALGEIEELNSTACIVCPWHYYHISLQDGEKWYQGTQPDDSGKLQPGPWKSVGRRQRTHQVEERPDGIYVRLDTEGSLASDEYACKHECGDRVKNGRIRLNPKHVHAGDNQGAQPYSPKASPPSSPRHPSEGEDVWPDDLDPAQVQHQHVLQMRRRSSPSGLPTPGGWS